MRAARTASRASAPGRAAGSSRAAGGPGRRAARTPRHGVLRRRTSAGDAVSSPVSGCQVVARRQDLPSARCRSPPGPGRAYASVASWRPVREARAAGQISGRRIVLVRGVVAAPMSHGSRPLLGAAIRCVPPMNAKNIHLALALALRPPRGRGLHPRRDPHGRERRPGLPDSAPGAACPTSGTTRCSPPGSPASCTTRAPPDLPQPSAGRPPEPNRDASHPGAGEQAARPADGRGNCAGRGGAVVCA